MMISRGEIRGGSATILLLLLLLPKCTQYVTSQPKLETGDKTADALVSVQLEVVPI